MCSLPPQRTAVNPAMVREASTFRGRMAAAVSRHLPPSAVVLRFPHGKSNSRPAWPAIPMKPQALKGLRFSAVCTTSEPSIAPPATHSTLNQIRSVIKTTRLLPVTAAIASKGKNIRASKARASILRRFPARPATMSTWPNSWKSELLFLKCISRPRKD